MLTTLQATLLIEGARLLNVFLSKGQIEQFSIYLTELLRWSKIVDLVSQTDGETIIRKHFLDSLAISSFLPIKAGKILDLGSGAGFPGLPLAIVNENLFFTLLEPRRKRINFLKEVIRKGHIINAQVYEGRTEEITARKEWHSAFDLVVTRATWNIKDLVPRSSPFLKTDGFLLTMKGLSVQEELEAAKKEVLAAGFVNTSIQLYSLPYGNEKRAALLFAKKSFT